MPYPKGHRRIELSSAGERKRSENSWTWVCECGATESASTKAIALDEWRFHMERVRAKAARQRPVVIRLTMAEAKALSHAVGNSTDHPDVMEALFDDETERDAALRAVEKLNASTRGRL